MALHATAVKNARPRDKAYRLFDEKGLYFEVRPNGARYWRMKYRFAGLEKLLAIGVWPDVGLKKAREERDNARKLLADGVDPMAVRHARRAAQEELAASTFEAVAREWYRKHEPNWAPNHSSTVIGRLEHDVFHRLGSRPIGELKAPELLAVLQRVEKRGAVETARRIRQICGQVFRYAIATGRAERDVSADLRGALPPAKVQHRAAITEPRSVGALLRALEGYDGSAVTRCALRFAPLVFVRPGELRRAQWSEIDLDAAEWRIPAARMKGGKPHIVPLSRQAIAILRELREITGNSPYLFPSVRTWRRPMSENTVNAALRRLGYAKEKMTGHGFRSMASTLLNEQGWNRDAIERQLAHTERNGVRAAYNHADHLPERRRMMQEWADYLERLAAERPQFAEVEG